MSGPLALAILFTVPIAFFLARWSVNTAPDHEAVKSAGFSANGLAAMAALGGVGMFAVIAAAGTVVRAVLA